MRSVRLPRAHAGVGRSIAAGLLLAIATAALAAERGIRDTQLTALQQFTNHGQVDWQVRWDTERGTIRSLSGQKTAALPLWAADRSAAVKQFFESNAALFRLRPGVDDLHMTWDRERRGIRHLRFQQMYHGVPVVGGEYAVAVDLAGSIRMINGGLIPDLDLDTNPAIQSAAAEDRAVTAVPQAAIDRDQPAHLAIVEMDQQPRLAWRVTVRIPSMEQFEVRVDARSGEVIETIGLSMHQIQCPEDGYHGNVWPLDGTSALTDVLLTNVTVYGKLDGQFVQVHNAEGQADAPKTDICGNFYYTSGNAHFTEVNTYYHLDQFLGEFLGSRGFPGLSYKLNAIVNRPEALSAYAGQTIYLWVGGATGGGWQNFGRAAEVVAHEAQHAVTESYGILYLAPETKALHEGLSDYFASSYTNEPRVGEWFAPVQCRTTGIRAVNTNPATFHYANFNQVSSCMTPAGGPHANGMILSGALWGIRSQLGAAFTDGLILDALDYMPTSSYFWSMLDAMVQADTDHHAGQNRTTIQGKFVERGITPNPSVAISGPLTVVCPGSGTFGAVAGGQNVVPLSVYQWSRRPVSPAGSSWTVIGTASSVALSNLTADVELRLTAIDAYNRSIQFSRVVDVVPSVSISGPTTMEAYDCQNFTATTPCGVVTYAWQRREFLPDIGPNGTWGPWANLAQTTATIPVCANESNFELRVTVTAADGSQATAIRGCTVTGGGWLTVGLESAGGSNWVVRDRAAVSFAMPAAGRAEVVVVDVKGRLVRTLHSGRLEAGPRRFEWRTDDLASGVYFYRVIAGNRIRNHRFLVLH